jgi:hypothetical protein
MAINNETFDNVIKLEDTDEIFEKTLELLGSFREKYEDISKLNDDKVFKNEVKVIFSLLHHVFSSEDLEDEDLDQEDFDKFQNLIFHIKNVIQTIDEYDLKDPNESTTVSISFILKYFEDSKKEMDELNNVMDKTIDKLKELETALNNKNKLNDICRLLKEERTEENDKELLESKKWCQNRLKEFNKDMVIRVIKNNDLKEENYTDKINDDLSLEEKTELNDLINIDLIFKMILNIELKLKN